MRGQAATASDSPLSSDGIDEGSNDLLLTGLLEVDQQVIAVDAGDQAVTEFLVEHPFPMVELARRLQGADFVRLALADLAPGPAA